MSAINRCETCNVETAWPARFCSAQCEKDFWDAMGYPDDDEIFDVPHTQTEPEPDDLNDDDADYPPYLDDYYKPYSDEWLD